MNNQKILLIGVIILVLVLILIYYSYTQKQLALKERELASGTQTATKSEFSQTLDSATGFISLFGGLFGSEKDSSEIYDSTKDSAYYDAQVAAGNTVDWSTTEGATDPTSNNW